MQWSWCLSNKNTNAKKVLTWTVPYYYYYYYICVNPDRRNNRSRLMNKWPKKLNCSTMLNVYAYKDCTPILFPAVVFFSFLASYTRFSKSRTNWWLALAFSRTNPERKRVAAGWPGCSNTMVVSDEWGSQLIGWSVGDHAVRGASQGFRVVVVVATK